MKRIYYTLILAVALLAGPSAFAQQPTQYSLFQFNKYAYNHAYNGLDASLSATGVFRKQWLSFPGTPLQLNFNAHLPLEMISSGAGIGVEYDVLGAYRNLSIRGSYSYIIDLEEFGKLSIGASGRFFQKQLDGSLLLTPDGTYEVGVNHNDPNLPVIRETGTAFTVDAAAYYQHEFFEIGVAAINLTQPRLELATDVDIQHPTAFFFMASGRINLNKDFQLEPALLLKTDFVKLQGELSAVVNWRKRFWGGIAFRGYEQNSIDALIFIVGMQVNPNIRINYAYDASIGSLQSYNTGSHEVMVNYNLNKKIGKEIPSKIIYNPRFL